MQRLQVFAAPILYVSTMRAAIVPKPHHEPSLFLGSTVNKAHNRRLGGVLVLICIVPLLTGCMEALQTGQPVDHSPPSMPSATVATTAAPPALGEMSPTLPGSFAPDPATAAPTLAPTLTAIALAPTAAAEAQPLPTLALPTPVTLTNEERWRAQQIDRRPFEAPRPYFTVGSELWWYDPLNQQSVILGRITGDFSAQAEFILRGQGVPALEVPYQVNASYGLTALSPALIDRIRAAGYSEWIETYVLSTPNVIPR
jgi:hypothetical protein